MPRVRLLWIGGGRAEYHEVFVTYGPPISCAKSREAWERLQAHNAKYDADPSEKNLLEWFPIRHAWIVACEEERVSPAYFDPTWVPASREMVEGSTGGVRRWK